MACKLPHEELNEINKVLESKYTGEKLESAKAEMKSWYESERSRVLRDAVKSEESIDETSDYNAKTLALNTVLFDKGSEIVVNNNGKKYVEKIESIKYLKDGKIEVIAQRKKESERNKYVVENGINNETGVEIVALKSAYEIVKRYLEREKDISGLGSENGYRSESIREDFEKQNLDLVNNPENMIVFMESLIDIDDVKISDEHKARLTSVIKMIADNGKNFIPDTFVYLNKQAEKNGGFIEFSGSKKGIYIGVGGNGLNRTEMSAAEAYVHELVHAATEYAKHNRKSEVSTTILRLQDLRSDAMKALKFEDFLPDNQQYNSVEEIESAKKTYEYLTDPEVGLSEFIAMGMTNEKMIKKLEEIKVYRDKDVKDKGFFSALYDMIDKLLRLVMSASRHERPDIKGDELLIKLTIELAKSNNKAMIAKRAGIASKVGDGILFLNDSISKFLKGFQTVIPNVEKPDFSANKFEKAKWFSKNLFFLLSDEKARPHLENFMSEAMGRRPEGFTQTFVRDLREKDGFQRIIESLGLESGSIDRTREHEVQIVGSIILNAFDKHPTKEEQEAMTLAFLDTDISTIYEKYGIDKMKKLLSDSEALMNEISSVRARVYKSAIDKKTANYYVSQASGLGFYMATHKGNIAQLLNARNIANKLNTEKPIKADESIVELIDELATLEALSYTSGSQIDITLKLIEKEEVGVRNFVALHKSFKEKARRELFESVDKDGNTTEGYFNEIKGYTKEIFDADVTVEVSPLRDRVEMEKEGFTYVETLKKHKNDGSKETMALFVNDDKLTQSYNRTALRLTDMGRKGTTLLDARYKGDEALSKKLAEVDVRKMNHDASKLIEQMMENPILEKGEEDGMMIPIYNKNGVGINYRYMMSKKKKRELLKQDIRAAHVMGRMEASIKDKIDTKKFNDKVIDVLVADAAQNNFMSSQYGQWNNKEYYFIGPKATNPDAMEAWRVMPTAVKDRIKFEIEKSIRVEAKKKGLKLRRNKKGELVVESTIKASEIKDPEKNTVNEKLEAQPKWLTDKYKGLPFRADVMYGLFGFRDASIADMKLLSGFNSTIKHWIRLVELLWKEIVRVSKVNIIIKTPQVLIGNIVSNIALCVQLGINPIDAFKLQLDGVRSLRKYLNDETELEKLKLARDSGNVTGAEIKRINELENNLKENPARDLFLSGLYQSIVEDASIGDLKASSKLTRKIDEKLENFPEFVKNGVDMLFITERTKLFKMITFATQASDFAARYALIEGLKAQGVNKTEAMNTAKDAFIIYSNPDSKLFQYMNDMGLVMFTKYFMRIQRVISKGALDHPISFLLALIGQASIMDIDDITDQSMFSKDLTKMFYSPMDVFTQAIYPSSAEYAEAIYKALK